MKPNQVMKYLAIVLPLLTAACTTTTDEETMAGQSNQNSNAQTSGMNKNEAVEVTALERERQMKIEEEKRKQAALRQTNTLYFDFDDSKIMGKYFDILEAHASYLRANPSARLIIEGHADERGTPEYNIALGERRAKAVARYLQNLGVSNTQISTVSYGEEKPLNKSRTEAAFAENRRAVLVY
ncbi:peptidoglycan-associated lipoprotein Pal [Gayadomonas joobiniege]|uniref:peptidoglycan-associated lipoprotein Pal n=1 Tax=Gayadomonas joobiniege TaxID=1234606 RepID=UPI0003705309|nr:peptidoglycan-associated lipoprotein Pal [Gayadomonas joobiniege]